jgi:hypothetical protein
MQFNLLHCLLYQKLSAHHFPLVVVLWGTEGDDVGKVPGKR